MIYVSSDLHGCSPAKFQQLLRKANFNDNDFLFILGDVIDRDAYGAELLSWLTQQPNMQTLLGNHEALLLACSFLFDEVTEESLDCLTTGEISLVENWLANGGGLTIKGFQRLLKHDPELVDGILAYLQEAPLYEELEVNGNNFVLVHAGLDNFRPDKPLSDYKPEELLLARPSMQTQYYHDAVVIFGHTPTAYFGKQFQGHAVHTDTWICIDTGAASGNLPMLLRLDDGKEFY